MVRKGRTNVFGTFMVFVKKEQECVTADLVTSTEEVLNGRLHFLCSVKFTNFFGFTSGFINLFFI